MTDNTPRPEPMSRESVLAVLDFCVKILEADGFGIDLDLKDTKQARSAVAALYERCEALERDKNYYLWKLGIVIPVFQEARDALCALTTTQIKLRGISATLATRMDYAGTADVEQYLEATTGTEPSDAEGEG